MMIYRAMDTVTTVWNSSDNIFKTIYFCPYNGYTASLTGMNMLLYGSSKLLMKAWALCCVHGALWKKKKKPSSYSDGRNRNNWEINLHHIL